MSIKYIKKSSQSASVAAEDTTKIVRTMLHEIELGGEARTREYARELDGWDSEIIVGDAQIAAAKTTLDSQTRRDIEFSHARVKKFANDQLQSMHEFETELSPGLFAGQKLVPVETAGCYIPGGRYAHIASAIMSITTAKVAGVDHIIACSPAQKNRSVHPAILYAADLAGADTILALGGVQGIAALAFGHFSGHAADILVGPGNRFVAEAKRILFGRVGIDLFAGPTEILIIADSSADPELVAADLIGQAEHGPDSPAWLISLDEKLANNVLELIPQYIARLPNPNRMAAQTAWHDVGEIVVVDNRDAAVKLSDAYAPEHLEVHCENHEWYVQNLRNYGSLFLGEQTTVAYGDKCAGPNHILPTKRAARYTGGLSVGKFIKVLTWQRMQQDANREVGAATARISRAEGMDGHALTGDDRLAKYFPGERFELGK